MPKDDINYLYDYCEHRVIVDGRCVFCGLIVDNDFDNDDDDDDF